LLYVPANFLPASSGWERWVLVVTVFTLAGSALVGILFYARATTILVNTAPTPPGAAAPAYTPDFWLKLWGYIHIGSLVLCFVVAGLFFFTYKVIAVVPANHAECVAALTDAAGKPVTVTFPCKP
jgi:hypothetical protein